MPRERRGARPPERVLTNRPVVVYDGSCGFCRKSVLRLKRWDRDDRIDLLSLQDDRAPALTRRSPEALRRAAHVVLPDGTVYAGARGFRELCRYLPAGGLVRGLLHLPGALPLAERVYGWIARRWGPVGPGHGSD